MVGVSILAQQKRKFSVVHTSFDLSKALIVGTKFSYISGRIPGAQEVIAVNSLSLRAQGLFTAIMMYCQPFNKATDSLPATC